MDIHCIKKSIRRKGLNSVYCSGFRQDGLIISSMTNSESVRMIMQRRSFIDLPFYQMHSLSLLLILSIKIPLIHQGIFQVR